MRFTQPMTSATVIVAHTIQIATTPSSLSQAVLPTQRDAVLKENAFFPSAPLIVRAKNAVVMGAVDFVVSVSLMRPARKEFVFQMLTLFRPLGCAMRSATTPLTDVIVTAALTIQTATCRAQIYMAAPKMRWLAI